MADKLVKFLNRLGDRDCVTLLYLLRESVMESPEPESLYLLDWLQGRGLACLLFGHWRLTPKGQQLLELLDQCAESHLLRS